MNKYLTFDDEYDMYDIKKPALAKFLISQGFDKLDIKEWFDDHDAYDESIINSFEDLEESTEEEIEDWAKTEMEFYSEGNNFNINENKVSKEFFRMQMLAGIITESQLKEMEQTDKAELKPIADYLNSNEDALLDKLSSKSELYGIDYSSFFPFEQTSDKVATSTGGEGTIHASFKTDDLVNDYPEDEVMQVMVKGRNIYFGTPDNLF